MLCGNERRGEDVRDRGLVRGLCSGVKARIKRGFKNVAGERV